MQIVYRFLLEKFRLIEGFSVYSKYASALSTFIIILLLSYVAFLISRKILLYFSHRVAAKTTTQWDDILVENRVFKGLSNLVPALIIFYTAGFAGPNPPVSLEGLDPISLFELKKDYILNLDLFIIRISKLYLIGIGVFLINALLNSVLGIYETTEYSETRSIKGYIQLIKIFIYSMAGILVIAYLFKQNPWDLVIGLGTMAAVILLIFKDTILGFVASIQLSANQMVKLGDWITVPKHNADGIVIDMTLNTVKIQNWDKTISTVPTYSLVSESFSNWKGMEESDGRRIKRSVLIDMGSIKFCDSAMLNRFQKFNLIRDYVIQKEAEVQEYNKGKNLAEEDFISGRRQTNVGVFRKYLETYLQHHPMINQEMTLIVRQLQPTPTGLPVEIYAFCSDKSWAAYEAVQSDIFDHVLAVVPEFELKVFQQPSGADFTKALGKV